MHLKPPLPPPHHGQLCAVAELQLHAPRAKAKFHFFCSAHNPGAEALAQTLDDGRVTVANATIFCRARRRACAPTSTLRTRPPSYSDFNQPVLAARRGG